ncbi:hypothetical protein BVX99_03325 [bacterium F16]|nr:hypothetical protein BVX99_03325 [bacterium F16]
MKSLAFQLLLPCMGCIDEGACGHVHKHEDSATPYGEHRKGIPAVIPEGWKICLFCVDTLFNPRGCNLGRQGHCHGCEECERDARRLANRRYYRKQSSDEGWRESNVMKMLIWRRNRRYGFDTAFVEHALELFATALDELADRINKSIKQLNALETRLTGLGLLWGSGYLITVRTSLSDSGNRLNSRWDKLHLALKTVPGVVLPDHRTAC